MLPHYKQEKDNTCALACLRMVLASFGIHVQESELEACVTLDPLGLHIDDLERLARQFHLDAEIRDTTVEELGDVLAAGKLPIAFIDRAVLDLPPRQRITHSIRDAVIHTVVPVRVTARTVALHDPRLPRITRKTIRLFRRAYSGLGGRSVVCSQQVSDG